MTEKSRMFVINCASVFGFWAIGGGHVTASKVFSFLIKKNCQTPIVIARWSLSGKHQHGRLGVIILLGLRCCKNYIFLVFSEQKFQKVKRMFLTPSRQPLNWFSWNLASLFSDSFAWKLCLIFVFFFRFWKIIIFVKEGLMICPLWLYPIVAKEQMHVSKIWDTIF